MNENETLHIEILTLEEEKEIAEDIEYLKSLKKPPSTDSLVDFNNIIECIPRLGPPPKETKDKPEYFQWAVAFVAILLVVSISFLAGVIIN